jgi:hypothetical protein
MEYDALTTPAQLLRLHLRRTASGNTAHTTAAAAQLRLLQHKHVKRMGHCLELAATANAYTDMQDIAVAATWSPFKS